MQLPRIIIDLVQVRVVAQPLTKHLLEKNKKQNANFGLGLVVYIIISLYMYSYKMSMYHLLTSSGFGKGKNCARLELVKRFKCPFD